MKLWDKILTLEKFQKKNTLPDLPGVYFFLGAKKELLYIGKATILRDRVKSYFSHNVLATRGPKIGRMLELTRFVAYRTADSVLEAFILETNLIKQYQPPHNTSAKDDKSFNYVVITREKYPRVLVKRGRDILHSHQTLETGREYQKIFGPFASGGALREALKIVRKIFPFRDKCAPYEEWFLKQKIKTRGGQNSGGAGAPCFMAQIGLCPGVCEGTITAREYQRTIRNIIMFFEGRKNQLLKKLEREMQTSAKNLEFERAGEIKKTLFALRHIRDTALIKNESGILTGRIEAYDVAHLAGTASVGALVVVQNGLADTSQYRKFKLRRKHHGNDLTALQEILERRLKHTEWPLPDIIVVDGADLQIGAAKQALLTSGLTIPLIGVVKDAKHQPERLMGEEKLTKRFQKAILLANSEAHRFAITFHRHRRKKEFLP